MKQQYTYSYISDVRYGNIAGINNWLHTGSHRVEKGDGNPKPEDIPEWMWRDNRDNSQFARIYTIEQNEDNGELECRWYSVKRKPVN